MNTLDAIRARRDVREFSGRPISEPDLEAILDAGRRAPSALNRQPWKFVLCRERHTLEALARAAGGADHVAQSAATIALVAPRRDTEEARALLHFDLGQATMSMMLAAVDLGVASAHAAVRDEQAAAKALGLPPDHFCKYLIALGHPARGELRPVSNPDRLPLKEVVRYERWA